MGTGGALRELERTNRELVLREAHLRAILDAEPECVKVLDAAGLLVEMNPAGLAMLEVDSLEEARRTPLLDHLLPEHREAFVALHREVFRGGSGVLEFEIRGRRGTRRWLETHATPLRSAEGAIEGLLGLTRDVTDRRRAAAALEQSRAQYAGLVQSIDGIVWEADAESLQFTFVSERADRILGYPVATWLSELDFWPNHIHPEDRGHVVRSCLSSTRRGEDHVLEYRMVAADGRVVWLRDIVTYVEESGRKALLRGIMVDITERKAAEEQLHHAQKMESVGRLAAGIAHDFNNALTVINGIAEAALAELPDDAPLRHDLATIRDAGGRAAELTRQVLAFSRKQILRPEAVNLNTLVTEVEVLLRRMLGENIDVTLRLLPDLAPVMVDPGQFHHVLMNLAVNSRDAMPRGGIVTIETGTIEVNEGSRLRFPTLAHGRHVALVFRDTGVGMDSHTMQRVFEPFFTTKEPGKGTGLGLATVQGIVAQSGGGVSVESEPGVGTTVRVFLPAVEDGHAEQLAQTPGPVAARGGECVLVVDDDAGVRSLMRRVLERAGYTVHVAASGREALEWLEESPDRVHLVLTDIVMPGMSGPEMVKQIRSRNLPPRVLFTSGYADDTILSQEILPAGLPLLSKPFSADSLTATVRAVLDS